MTSLKTFRVVSFIEGLSYLLLVFVAMPLKYGFDQPEMVRVVGAAHGGLFVAFVAALIWATVAQRWPLKAPVIFFAASMVPFGFVYIEHKLRQEGAAPTESA